MFARLVAGSWSRLPSPSSRRPCASRAARLRRRKIQAAGECVDKERVASEIDKIVRKIMTDNNLKAVIAGVSVAGQPVLTKAWGESMTGVPATYDMHLRNGSVAIAYLGVVTLQLQEKGVLRLDDKLAKWFPDYPSPIASRSPCCSMPPILSSGGLRLNWQLSEGNSRLRSSRHRTNLD